MSKVYEYYKRIIESDEPLTKEEMEKKDKKSKKNLQGRKKS